MAVTVDENKCKNCIYAKPAGYRQVICKKTNTWQVELYSCPWFKKKEDKT